ncbi:MAG: hypothetical protein JWM11_5495 [Planctomycetaceae bacterium]|nr:hypothetical protein [Planctomycetaceae bacterium]
MPLHDWNRVPAGLFHHFHQHWSIEITTTLNRGRLPKGLSALVEQRAGPKEPDVLAIEGWNHRNRLDPEMKGGVATQIQPVTRIVRRSANEIYSDRANRIVIKHQLGRIVAVIEILSPGNKDSRSALRDFVEKTIDFLRVGIHVLVVDIFPPTPRDPFGIHKAIWDEILDEEFTFPTGKDRILASYQSSGEQTAYVEPIAVGDSLPDMPLFLIEDLHVMVPLELTYQAAWDASPEALRLAVETGILPQLETE